MKLTVRRQRGWTQAALANYEFRALAYFDSQNSTLHGVAVCAARFRDRRWWIVASYANDDLKFKPRGPFSLKVAVAILRLAS